jgi:cyclopropane fatty-acyl-phospholipid synthase-like methyltransferase
MSPAATFWNRFADRYAARPIKDVAAYEAMLTDAAARLRPGDRVLEIGCGTGGTAIRLAAGVTHYVATDFSAEMIRIAKAKPGPPTLRFQLAEAGELPDGGPFDAICAFNVLHLVQDLPGLLRSLHGGLAPGGQLICKTWCFGDLPLRFRLLFRALRLLGLFPQARFLTQAQLKQALHAAGFTIVALQVFGARAENPYIVAEATERPSANVIHMPLKASSHDRPRQARPAT